jgi:hypothetical protein
VSTARAAAYSINYSSGYYGNRNPHSRVPWIKQKIAAFDEIDIAMVGVCPSSRPGLSDFEMVAAVPKMRMARHHSQVAHGKVVLTSKVRPKMFIGNVSQLGASFFMLDMPLFSAPLLMGDMALFGSPFFMRLALLLLVGFVPFFLAHLSSFPVPVLVLSSGGNSACQQK